MEKKYILLVSALCFSFILHAQSRKNKSFSKEEKIEKEEKINTKVEKVPLNLRISNSAIGAVKFSDNYEELLKKFGKINILDDELPSSPESDHTEIKTIINIGEETEVIISWDTKAFHKKISAIEVNQPEFPFITKEGISYGTTLEELEVINGAPISFYSFGQSLGGTITNLNNGKLEKNSGIKTLYELSIDGIMDEDISGVETLKSDESKIGKYRNKIYVSKITLIIGK
ncbi:MAG TPA: hypothetical protein VLZ83_06200 [Edaphocola sp.]|nr:hypothetical protein [Edaphocola sp.]